MIYGKLYVVNSMGKMDRPKGAPVFPINVTVNLYGGVDPMVSKFDTWEEVTHVKLSDTDDLSVYDGATLLKEYPAGVYDSYTVEEVIPEIEEYKGEGFPL